MDLCNYPIIIFDKFQIFSSSCVQIKLLNVQIIQEVLLNFPTNFNGWFLDET